MKKRIAIGAGALAKETLRTAAQIIGGPRAETHGDMLRNHANIAGLWSAYLAARPDRDAPLLAYEAAQMMALLKISRTQLGAFNSDDDLDTLGYVAIAAELRHPAVR